MSKYLLNKFLYTVDRDPELVEAYRADPYGLVARWEAEYLSDLTGVDAERTTWSSFTDAERDALHNHDYVRSVRNGRPPVPDVDPVHRAVRARSPGAAVLPTAVRPGARAHHAAAPDIAT